jgi:hypothetical protein
VAVAAAAAWAVGRRATAGVRDIERRFEPEAIALSAPWLAAYLALAARVDPGPGEWGRIGILRDLADAVGFTVVGYLLAEAWGRRGWRYRRAAWPVAAVAAAAGVALAALGPVPPSVDAVAFGVAARAVAAVYGGWIYHLQRAHVRALVDARRPGRTRAAAGSRPAAARPA